MGMFRPEPPKYICKFKADGYTLWGIGVMEHYFNHMTITIPFEYLPKALRDKHMQNCIAANPDRVINEIEFIQVRMQLDGDGYEIIKQCGERGLHPYWRMSPEMELQRYYFAAVVEREDEER